MLGIVVPFVEKDMAEPCTDQRAYHKVRQQYSKPFLRRALMLEHLGHYVVAYDESYGERESIPTHAERAESENDGADVPDYLRKHRMLICRQSWQCPER